MRRYAEAPGWAWAQGYLRYLIDPNARGIEFQVETTFMRTNFGLRLLRAARQLYVMSILARIRAVSYSTASNGKLKNFTPPFFGVSHNLNRCYRALRDQLNGATKSMTRNVKSNLLAVPTSEQIAAMTSDELARLTGQSNTFRAEARPLWQRVETASVPLDGALRGLVEEVSSCLGRSKPHAKLTESVRIIVLNLYAAVPIRPRPRLMRSRVLATLTASDRG